MYQKKAYDLQGLHNEKIKKTRKDCQDGSTAAYLGRLNDSNLSTGSHQSIASITFYSSDTSRNSSFDRPREADDNMAKGRLPGSLKTDMKKTKGRRKARPVPQPHVRWVVLQVAVYIQPNSA